ncbi:MAG: recombinase family protein [Prevotella sp.]|nr:recombinase family protein [Prevotella sp.]
MNTQVVAFCRVSTSLQEYERQSNELTTLANSKGWKLEATFAEKISGAKKNTERKELMRMVEYVKTHNISKVLVTELSRLGRDTLQVLQVIELLNKEGISLYIQNYNIETLTEDGKVNPMSQFLITILAEVARMERKTIRERIESGYNNFRANGGMVGRKVGYRKSEEQMREQYAEEIRLLKKGYSLRNVQKITSTSINTLRKVKKLTEKQKIS